MNDKRIRIRFLKGVSIREGRLACQEAVVAGNEVGLEDGHGVLKGDELHKLVLGGDHAPARSTLTWPSVLSLRGLISCLPESPPLSL